MRLHNLKLKNIGPFKEGEIEFIPQKGNVDQPPVTIITGENGTGKTIVLDAIRGLLFGPNGQINREIVNNSDNFQISAEVFDWNNRFIVNTSDYVKSQNIFETNQPDFNLLFNETIKLNTNPKWIANYWTSLLSDDSYKISTLITPKPEEFLYGALRGIKRNSEVVKFITFFDYLRTSETKKEKETGTFFYEKLKNVIKISLDKGELAYVKRTSLEPIILQNEKEITLDKLSSGNLYLIQRMVSLLGQMYAIHVLHNVPLNKVCKTPGLLLIDEAENHLHPKWQKTFINNILEIFPNLQIILTTHSPFIVSSVKNARVYVCKSMDDHAIIEDQTAEYANMPVEEILISPLFGATYSFNSEISNLIIERKEAIDKGNKEIKEKIEAELKRRNPEYFAYLDTEKLLKELSNS